MNEAEERKAYDDWLHRRSHRERGRAALAQPEPAAPTEPAPGWCKHCQQYTIDEPLPAAPTVGEPDMRHPKIQRLIGGNARRDIEIGLIEQLLEDPDCELTSMGMEYWGPMHDKLREKLLAAHPPRTALSDAELACLYIKHARCQEEGPLISGWFDFARAIEAAHNIGGPRNE